LTKIIGNTTNLVIPKAVSILETNHLKLKNMTTYNIPKHLTGLSEEELKISQSKFLALLPKDL
jgi:hypothetical protein